MRDWTGTTVQREALTVGCPHCRAPAGELCVNAGKPLQAFPAHEIRDQNGASGTTTPTNPRKPPGGEMSPQNDPPQNNDEPASSR